MRRSAEAAPHLEDSTTEGPRTLKSAVVWSYALSGGRLAITTLLSFVLAAMLGPSVFGLVAMALAFIGLVELVLQQGLLPAIVQRRDLRPEHLDTAFWLVISVAAALTLLTLLLAPVWGRINGSEELVHVLWALSALVPIQGVVVVQEAVLRRSLNFRALAVRGVLAALVGAAAGLGGALAGWGVWALVAQQVSTSVVGAVVLWACSPWRPARRFDRAAAAELYRFSSRSSLASLGLFVGGRGDVILAGALFGPVVVGVYKIAQRMTDTVIDVSARAMQPVALSALAARQDDLTSFRHKWLTMQKVTVALSLPLLGLLWASAPVLTGLLGEDWSGTTMAIRILVVAQAFGALSLLTGPALQAGGRPGALAALMWFRAGLLMFLLLIAGFIVDKSGTDAHLLALLLVATTCSVLTAITGVVIAARHCAANVGQLAGAWLPGILAAVGVALIAFWAVAATEAWGSLARLAFTSVLSGLAGLALVCLSSTELRHLLARLIERRRSPLKGL